ncbi:hypothetical protein BKH41_06470 [Helicobacter sp. 12S02232-10]|uniref:vacuolating cyotoxin family protein n=1 Tax=Helicobacter sp. 12S02232-10 TaxID=1476197 RepID=UPI000BA683B2|nr:vacuolating cyotoxin family protein [Helicobacter sp. 12S02232-10]PAF47908.1 hypothetical protein BKH41_06470 [Helicobacter sp. 12S02232-10]
MIKIPKLVFCFSCAFLFNDLVYAETNATNDFYYLYGKTYNDNGYISGLSTGSSKTYTPTYNFGNHYLAIRNKNYIGPGYLGHQSVTIIAKNINFEANSLLKMGNGSLVGSSSDLTINGDVSMASGSMLEGQRGSITINGSISGSGKIQTDSGYALNIKGATDIALDTLNTTGTATLNASNNITINNFTLSGNTNTLSAKNLTIANTLNLYENATLNALGVSGNITIGTLTNATSIAASFRTGTLDTHANVTITDINLNNFTSGRSLAVNTHGYGDITLNGALKLNGSAGGIGLAGSTGVFNLNGKNITFNQDVTLGYYTSLKVSGTGTFNAQKINVGNGSTTGNTTLDFSGIQGATTIKALELSTASVYGSNFTIGSLTAHKGASRSIFYNNIGTSTIDTLYLADNGTSTVDNSILEFKGGGTSLDVKTLKTDKWAILDASVISKLTIGTLESNYSTIKAKDLTLNNGTFSSGATYLYADTTTSNGTISLDNSAELWLKSGQSFTADTLNMKNSSKLYAASDNGGMKGTTTINHIIFDNSQIYANNLTTQDIQVKNNGSVTLSKGSAYTNQGDLNITDGSYLEIHNGDFINNGELNITLGADPKKNAKNLINVLDGSFTFDMTKYSTGKTDTYKDASGIPEYFSKDTDASDPKNPYYATFELKDADGKVVSRLNQSQISEDKIVSDNQGHYYIPQTDASGKTTNYYLQYIDANGNAIGTDATGYFNKNTAQSAGYKTLTGDIKVPKAAINVTLDPSGLSAGTTYNLLTTKSGIQFKDGSIIYNSSTSQYAGYKKELNQRVNFTTSDGSTLAITYWMSDDNKTIGFQYDTGKHYIDAQPFIKPGTWVLGIGSGAAAFGSMGGIPGASGLAKSYTLKLQAQQWHNNVTGQDESTVYFLQNLNYNNYGNTSAVFTIDAIGSDFALGKNQDIGGIGGVINIGPYNAKSNMVLKADNIYLGGTINLGDGALISGHLDLEAKNSSGSLGKILGDDPNAIINVKNHSSLKAVGSSFDYKGTINLNGNKTITDEVGLDLSGITGKITIGTLNATAARPNSVDKNAGIKMKDFTITNLNVYNGNGGSINNFYSEFTTNIGDSSIGTLTLVKGTTGVDQAGLKFSGGGNSLTIDTANINESSFLDASKITNVYINKALNIPDSPEITFDRGVHGVIFDNLTLNDGAIMNYGGPTNLTINGDFTNKYGLMNVTPKGSTIQTINVKGNASFYFNDNGTDSSGIATPLIKISDVKGLKLNQKYTLLKTGGTITYIYTNSEGKIFKSTDSKDNANNLYNEMADRIALLNSDGSQSKDAEKTVNDKEISFIIKEEDKTNPYDPNDIRYWFYKKGGKVWINDIGNTGASVMDWLQVLMIDKHNGLWAKDRVFSNDLNYFVRVSSQLQSTMGQLSSVNRKNNSTAATRLATDVNKMSRLVKLSSTKANMPTFADMLRDLEKKHFADARSGNINAIYKYANRNLYKNNVWATAIGTASFVDGGNSTLYGINAGYDRFINNVIIGGYIAYAQGKYNGDIIRNNSYNANAGLYSRAYIGNSEFDISASETFGFNKEEIYSQDMILSQLNQSYHYNTYTTNINVNYGYVFGISEKSVVIKPQIGLSYYYIAATKILGNMVNPVDNDLRVDADPDQKQDVALNLAIETRQYFKNSSYWYFIAGISRDLFLKSKGDQEVRFVGNNTLSYKKGDQLNTYASLTAGGEMELFRRIYVNLGLGAKAGMAYKDINISGNVGMRYVF